MGQWILERGLGLERGPKGLVLGDIVLADLDLVDQTPRYLLSRSLVQGQLAKLQRELARVPGQKRIYYAIKANREPALLRMFCEVGGVGIDCCSPREVELALSCGFSADQISVTAGMLSDRDLRQFVSRGVHCNLDTRSALRRYAAIPGHNSSVGLRLDPQVRVGWGEDHQTSQARTSYGGSKFGFPMDQAEEVVEFARGLGLLVDTLHMHVGWGVQASALPQLVDLWRRFGELAARIPSVSVLNVGGGLGVPHRPEDQPLSVQTWAGALRESLADFLEKPGKTLACEPGTFLVAPAGALIVEVNTVEDRPSGRWVGVDAGHNTNVYAAHYGIPLAVVPLGPPREGVATRVHLAGNINEANDVFARDLLLPPVAEGDLLVFYPCGAYGASMASDHCMRGGVVQMFR